MRVENFGTYAEKFERYLNYEYKLIYQLGCSTGLRISDIVAMTKDKLEIERPTIKEQKTQKSKRIYIPKKLREELIEFSAKHDKYIFESKSKTGHITRQAVHKYFKRVAERLDIPKNIGTHSMRKTYARKLILKHKNYKYVQSKLNHETLSETLLYVLDTREL